MDLGELNVLVGKRHEENKAEFRRLGDSIRKVQLELAETRGGNRAFHTAMTIISAIVIPLLVVGLEHVWK